MATRDNRARGAWASLLSMGLAWGCHGGEALPTVEASPSVESPNPESGPEAGQAPPAAELPAEPSRPEKSPETPPGGPETPLPPAPSAPRLDARRPWLRGSIYPGVSPEGLAVGDFDGDGAPDVAVSLGGRNSAYKASRHGALRVLRNDGRGGLTVPQASLPLDNSTGLLLAADMNGDGRLDALAGSKSGTRVLFGQGDGSLRAWEPWQGLCPYAVDNVGLWRDSTGSPWLWAAGPHPNWENLDDSLPCVARPAGADRFTQWNGTSHGDGLFASGASTVADFDGDGFADLMFGAEHGSSLGQGRLFLGDASGRFTRSVSLPLLPDFEQVRSADFNHDGHPDLLGLAKNTLWVLLNSGQGDFTRASSSLLPAETWKVVVVDLDGDVFPDVVALHVLQNEIALRANPAEVSLWRGSAEGVLRSWGRLAVGRLPSDAVVVDLKRNGTRELLVAEADDNTVSVYMLPREPVTGSPQSLACPMPSIEPRPAAPVVMSPLAVVKTGAGKVRGAVGDFDVDGKKDLAIALDDGGVRLVLHGDEDPPSPREVESMRGLVAVSLVAGDLDGDGREDLAGEFLVEGRESQSVDLYHTLLFWNEAPASFVRTEWDNSWWWPYELMAGDFNRDGRVDLVRSPLNGLRGGASSARFTSLGGREFQATELTDFNPTNDEHGWVQDEFGRPLAADFNGDGLLDIVHLTDSRPSLNFTAADGKNLPGGMGFGYFVNPQTFQGAVDVEGDGVPDLISADAYRLGKVDVMRGDGHGALQAPMKCELLAGQQLLAWEDLNADGTADVVSVSEQGTRLWVVPRAKGGAWAAPRVHELSSPPLWVRSVDLLGDARPELAVMLRSGQLLIFPTP